MKKTIKVIIMVMVLFFSNMIFVYAEDNSGSFNNGVKNGLIQENDKTYYYKDGKKQSGFQKIDGKTYFFSRVGDHAMRTGTFAIDGPYYHFNEDGAMLTGWYSGSAKAYYFNSTGKRVSGFQKIDGKTYFFSRVGDNAMRTGTFWIDGPYYHFNEDGEMVTGWYKENDKTFYFNSTGKRVSGFQKIDGKTYFFSRLGDNAMRTGTFAIDGPYYRFNDDGTMVTGWYSENGKTYYFDSTGKRAKGFQNINGDTYFFSRINDNQMRTGIFWIDNKYYYFADDGKQQTGTKWVDWNGNKYYLNNGIIQVGIQIIDNEKYVFDSTGKMRTETFVEGGKQYIFDENGEFVKLQYLIKTYYQQRDPRWASKKYGLGTMGGNGCTPTSLAMAFETILGRQVLPTEVADYLYYNTREFNKKTKGASGMAVVYASNYFDVPRKGITDVNDLNKALKDGKIVYAAMGNGKYATKSWNHAIIMVNINDKNETYVFDPLNENNNGWEKTTRIIRELSTDPDDKTGGYYLYALG